MPHLRLRERVARIEPHLLMTNRDARAPKAGWVPLGRGAWLPAEIWQMLTPEDRALAYVLAAHERAKSPPVFCDTSAAAILGLPLVSAADARVHTLVSAAGSNRNSVDVVRHHRPLNQREILKTEGLRCTTADRTLLDLARFGKLETAIACLDSHASSEFRVGRMVDDERLRDWKDDLSTRLAHMRGTRGVRRAERLLQLTDPRIESPLESISHLRLQQLGFEVELQVAVPGRYRANYYVDFELQGIGILAECDGKMKYVEDRLLGRHDIKEALYEEKRRHEWIESSTGKRLIRWGWSEVQTLEVFARMLTAFGVPIPRRYWQASAGEHTLRG